ncbi:MAG: biosynthetic arginine decarboxylase [Acidobacteriaceae bacterium]|nr:biosynthetic arginine decarboxylase [Acidobacteriaceae bacterium]MBV9308758.1 biosynthetic arginine decarboxylase [Acidobacteriaceae bacterium]MBV9678685.1 biosynthetic arginine decarboxylase [Acidobacteriaceae bacterium]
MSTKVAANGQVREPADRWTTTEAAELYDITSWGKGYFSVGANGNVLVHPTKESHRSIDLKQLVDTLEWRGISLPILIRFADILKHRLGEMHQAFESSIREHGYQGDYCCVYPIKVNQQRQVVEEVFNFGRAYNFGLEAGSKPELLAVLAIADNETPIICNGFKDDEYIEMVMLAKKIGRRIIPVVEKFTELDLIIKHAEHVGVKPVIGIRVKLASRGSGRWKSSGGYRSKFGLTVSEALKAVELLKQRGMEDSLQLLHFHLGSQITNIRQIKAAVIEAARIYVDLKKLGTGLKYLDVGGGLGIDYDGSQTDFESSVNYTLEEYARDVVYHIQNICDESEVPHPTIISESGRAVAAYHSVLVFNVLGVSGFGEEELPASLPEDSEQPLIDLFETHRSITKKNLLETYHDAQQALDSALNLFSLGYLTLEQRSTAENLYWAICRKILRFARELDFFPEELEGLDGMLSDTYFCNFSLFQSMPDSWAVKQLFPIMPIHRLNEPPSRHAVLGDISCDSDGKVDQFIDRRDVKKTLPLHTFSNNSYILGAFLLGAYQEILGDLHNLFGDTNAVHVSLNESGDVVLETVIQGDTVREVLNYVQYSAQALIDQFRKDVEVAVREQRIGYEESGRLLRFYEEGLQGYTYLEQ